MLKLEEILTQKGLGKVFFHENCDDLEFHVVFEPNIEDYILLVHYKDEIIQPSIVGSLIDGFYTKD